MNYALRKSDPLSLLDSFFSEFGENSTLVTPAADVYADEKSYYIDMDLPGFEKEEVSVEVKDNRLVVKAEHKSNDETAEQEDSGIEYYRRERNSTAFSRSFQLGDTLNAESIHAAFDNGVLKLSVPKKEESLPKQILIG